MLLLDMSIYEYSPCFISSYCTVANDYDNTVSVTLILSFLIFKTKKCPIHVGVVVASLSKKKWNVTGNRDTTQINS